MARILIAFVLMALALLAQTPKPGVTGGSTTGQGTYAALPATCAAGDLYLVTDSPYTGDQDVVQEVLHARRKRRCDFRRAG